MATIKLEIVTPEAKTFSDDVDMVTLTGTEGEMAADPVAHGHRFVWLDEYVASW